jgi:hypothetical protein
MSPFWQPEKKTLLWWTLSLTIGLSILGSGGYWYQQQSAHNQHLEKTLKTLKKRQRSLHQQKEQLIAHYDDYQQFMKQQITGPEKRQHWVTVMKDLRKERLLSLLEYHIELPQEVNTMTPLKVSKTTMVFNVSMWHEEDLTYFIEQLDRRTKSHFILKNCSLKQIKPRITLAIRKNHPGNFSAHCQAEWLSILPPT